MKDNQVELSTLLLNRKSGLFVSSNITFLSKE